MFSIVLSEVNQVKAAIAIVTSKLNAIKHGKPEQYPGEAKELSLRLPSLQKELKMLTRAARVKSSRINNKPPQHGNAESANRRSYLPHLLYTDEHFIAFRTEWLTNKKKQETIYDDICDRFSDLDPLKGQSFIRQYRTWRNKTADDRK